MLLFAFLSLAAAPAPHDDEIDYAVRPVVEGGAIVATLPPPCTVIRVGQPG
jgi:hypothetical protein